MTNEDISRLIELAKEGDKDAFGKIYQTFLGKIYRFIYFSVRDKSLAEDLTQNTFIKAWKALPSFTEKKASFQTFLFTIARNTVIDYTRKKKNVSLELIENIESHENIEELTFQKEEKEMVTRALSKLDYFEKHIVILRFFEEMSFAEIGEIVDKKEGAVRVHIHRILKKLKEIIERTQ